MENVYADLDLECNWDHPHVKGWRGVFETWAETEAFERTWRVSEVTYAERFRNFYNEKLVNGRGQRATDGLTQTPKSATGNANLK